MAGFNLQSNVQRLAFYRAEFDATFPRPPELILKRLVKHVTELNRIENSMKLLRERQKQLLVIFQIIKNIQREPIKTAPSVGKKKPEKKVDLSPEVAAMLQLAKFCGCKKVIGPDGAVIRPDRIDPMYKAAQRGIYVFSTSPVPAVYCFPRQGPVVSIAPAYTPFEEGENDSKVKKTDC